MSHLTNFWDFEIIPNPGEGNCLFHAISQALSYLQRKPRSHKKIRKDLVKHNIMKSTSDEQLYHEIEAMWKISDILYPKLKSSTKNFRNSKKAYRDRMRCLGEPGTRFELEAAGSLYSLQVSYFETNFLEQDASKVPQFHQISPQQPPESLHGLDKAFFLYSSCANGEFLRGGHWQFLIPKNICKQPHF